MFGPYTYAYFAYICMCESLRVDLQVFKVKLMNKGLLPLVVNLTLRAKERPSVF